MNKKTYAYFLFVVMISLSGCAKHENEFGHDDFDGTKIKFTINKTKSDEVLAAFGSPTIVSDIDGKVWYYISGKSTEYPADTKQKISIKILKLTFLDDLLKSIDIIHESQKPRIKVCKDITKFRGNTPNMIQQFASSIGKITP